jgi:hypothetical protein
VYADIPNSIFSHGEKVKWKSGSRFSKGRVPKDYTEDGNVYLPFDPADPEDGDGIWYDPASVELVDNHICAEESIRKDTPERGLGYIPIVFLRQEELGLKKIKNISGYAHVIVLEGTPTTGTIKRA